MKQVKANSGQDVVPEVCEWRPKALSLALVQAAALLLSPGPAAFAKERTLTRVVYEFAVTSYCGTLDPAVEAGFRRELAVLTARGGFDEETARHLRILGWAEADRQWSNHGLGGFRAWCRDEGIAAARHFRAIAVGEQQP